MRLDPVLSKIKSFVSFRVSGKERRRSVGAAAVFFIALGVYLFLPPIDFPSQEVIVINDGMTLSDIADYLKQESVVRSALVFKTLALLSTGEASMKAGAYYFDKPTDAISVVLRLARGQYNLSPVRVTIPEGATVADIANILEKRFPRFDQEDFLAKAGSLEGYLFPDTYFFLPTVTAEQVISQMTDTFTNRMETIGIDVKNSPHSLEDIVTMASILEKEAYTLDDKRMIAGILWKRIAEGMPLQVDSTFLYINGKNSFELTTADLAIDSPYNTYRNKGLPPGPIGNPGLDSLLAAVTPTDSPYFFYLSDKTGKLYYAVDFEQHKANKLKYLN